MPAVGQLIVAYRGWLRLTQGQLAQRVGVRQSTVSDWENGRAVPTRANLSALAAAFGVSPDQFGRGIMPAGAVVESRTPFSAAVSPEAASELPRRLQVMAKRFEAEALEMDASDDEMGWLRMNLYQPQTAKLFQMGQADRPATEAEQLEHFESFLKGLRANLEAQIALRTGKARSR